MIWENGIETCIVSYMKRVTSPGSLHNTGCLGLVHWDDPEGWYGEGGVFRMGNTCIPVVDSFDIWQNQYNIVKLKKNKNKQTKKKKPWIQTVFSGPACNSRIYCQFSIISSMTPTPKQAKDIRDLNLTDSGFLQKKCCIHAWILLIFTVNH